MSAADEAYREWSTHPRFNTWVSVENAFIEGYRRALEDMREHTDEIVGTRLELDNGMIWLHTAAQVDDWLRAWAAAVAPRETKD